MQGLLRIREALFLSLLILVSFIQGQLSLERSLSIPEVLVSKSFEQYYRKAREGQAMHLDEGLFVDFVEVMRVNTAGVTTHFPLSGISLAPAGGILEP
jgi:hypothetical protein